MSCNSCGNLGSNCSCSDNCPTRTSDITTFDCNNFNVIEVPCDASLCDVLGLLESYTTNMVNELSTMTSVVIGAENCIGLAAGTYGIQQVIDAILAEICAPKTCPLFVSISQGEGDELIATASGGTAPYSYQWNIQDNIGNVIIVGSTTGSSIVVGGEPGLNRFGLVKVTVTDNNGCSTSDTFFWRLPVID